MSENTAPAACSEAEFRMACKAGLLVVTTAEELAIHKFAEAIRAAAAGQAARTAYPLEKWHEDDGPALWWTFPVNEPPWCGQPTDDDWPHCHTHWTPLVVPVEVP